MAGLIREQVPLADGTPHPQPRVAALARADRRLGDRPALVGRRAQAGRRVLPSGQRRRHPPVHRVGGQRTARRVGRVAAGHARGDRPPPGRQARRAVVVRGAARAAAGARAASSATPARSTRSRPACCSSSPAARPGSPPTCPGLDKAYEAVVQFGAVSTTLDPEGEITPSGPATDAAAVAAAARGLVGEIVQAVPAASAVKVDGERAYARMRRGETVVPPPRRVTIHRLDVQRFDAETQRATHRRALLEGHVRPPARGRPRQRDRRRRVLPRAAAHARRRLRRGRRRDARRRSAPTRSGRWYRSAADALPHLPARALDDAEQRDVAHGRALRAPRRGRRHPPARATASCAPWPSRAASAAAGGGAVIVRQSLADVPPGERAVALGSFDGVHLGHRAVIGDGRRRRPRERGLKSAVITFHPPPIAVLRPERAAGAALGAQPPGGAGRGARRRRARDRALRPRVRRPRRRRVRRPGAGRARWARGT